jgi:hypothetical protein
MPRNMALKKSTMVREATKVRANFHSGIIVAFQLHAELIMDPTIEAIYIPVSLSVTRYYRRLIDHEDLKQLPNGLHFEWTAKALAAGKHVLLEKPSTVSSEETRKLFEIAKEKGVVLLEAFHYRSVCTGVCR